MIDWIKQLYIRIVNWFKPMCLDCETVMEWWDLYVPTQSEWEYSYIDIYKCPSCGKVVF